VQVRGLIGVRRSDDRTIDWLSTMQRIPRLVDIGVTDVQVMAESLGRSAAEVCAVLPGLVDAFRAVTGAATA